MTIREAAKEALQVQDACNLSGVVRSFARITEVLWEDSRQSPNGGTTFVNTHPVSVLFASKIGSLTGIGEGDMVPFARAYEWCQALVEHT